MTFNMHGVGLVRTVQRQPNGGLRMKLDKTTIIGSIRERDMESIGNAWKELSFLMEQNPFSEKMCFLLTHKEIAKVPVENKMGEISEPNCIGTAFFVADVSALKYPYHGYDFELDPHMIQPGEKSHDDMFHQHHERRIPGAFIFSYSVQSDGWHAGIYIGKIGEEHVAFAQHGHGGSFCLETVARNYCSPEYYIPSTLLKIQPS